MILADLKNYLREQHVVSLNDLVMHFDMDPDTIRNMLEVLIRKGQVRKIQETEVHCRKCAQCHMLASELYEWVE